LYYARHFSSECLREGELREADWRIVSRKVALKISAETGADFIKAAYSFPRGLADALTTVYLA